MAFSFTFKIIVSIVDIVLVAIVLYKLMLLIKGTRAVQLLKGLAVLILATTVSRWAGFFTINWMLEQTMTMVFVALPVVFQPELRRALEKLGRGKFFARPFHTLGEEDTARLISEIVSAVKVLAKNKTGALLVLERETGVNEFLETGTSLDGLVSSEFLINIFIPRSPLHDGAAILRGDRVAAAGCFLPLSENNQLDKELGTRHRAGLGLSEVSDAVAIIVSEETGIISVAVEGELKRYLDELTLTDLLGQLLHTEPSSMEGLKQRIRVGGK